MCSVSRADKKIVARKLFQTLAGFALLLIAALGSYAALSDSGLGDYASFVLAGEAHNRGWNPYASHAGLANELGLTLGFEDRLYSPNLNPPLSVYPFALLADVDPDVSRLWLRVVSGGVYLAACLGLLRAYPWQRRPLIVLWLLALAGFWYTLWMGQIYILLFGAGIGAWLLLERGQNPILAGVLIGVTVAIKPNFAVWPLLLLLAGHGRPALWCGVTALLISAVPLIIEGPGIYGQWLDAARDYSRGDIAANGSLAGSAARLGFEPAGYALGAAVAVVAAVYARRLRPAAVEASGVALVVALLAGPLTWLGYTLFALPVLLSRRWGPWEVAVAASLVVPWGVVASGEVHLAGTVVLGGLLASDAMRSSASGAATEKTMQAATLKAA
jgi:hypothetical protein